MLKKLILASCATIGLISLCSCSDSSIDFVEPSNPDNNINNLGTVQSNQSSVVTPSYTDEHNYTTPNLSITIKDEVDTEGEIEDTVDRIYDSVVSISAKSMSSSSSGSGVLFDYDSELGLSYLVTCFHVIDGASDLSITTSDGTIYNASLVGGYEDLDLAVLSVKADNLSYASFYDNSDNLRLGSTVICIGNPLGTLPGSVSTGCVSYNNRKISVSEYETMELIQTDVAINSGNSGGGLFNKNGALIGIVNAKYASSGIEGLGFAIPSNDVVDTINKLFSNAKYDSNNDIWQEGYIEGDFEFGFSLSNGYLTNAYGIPVSQVLYVSSISSNDTYTGVGYLNREDIIKGVTIKYKDETKEPVSLKDVLTSTSVMKFLNDSDISVGDSIEFSITRSKQDITVTVPVVQYIYRIY